jgi:cyanophycinase-like exopeptidase
VRRRLKVDASVIRRTHGGAVTARKPKGLLILSGGNDSSDGTVMRRLAEETKARGGKIVICTSPSAVPEETGPAHRDLFRELGLRKIEILDLRIPSRRSIRRR